jgi:hypothetical protein
LVQTLCTIARSCDAAPVRDDASRPKVKALVAAIHASSVSAAKKRQAGDVLTKFLAQRLWHIEIPLRRYDSSSKEK